MRVHRIGLACVKGKGRWGIAAAPCGVMGTAQWKIGGEGDGHDFTLTRSTASLWEAAQSSAKRLVTHVASANFCKAARYSAKRPVTHVKYRLCKLSWVMGTQAWAMYSNKNGG